MYVNATTTFLPDGISNVVPRWGKRAGALCRKIMILQWKESNLISDEFPINF